jgi:glycerol kinase
MPMLLAAKGEETLYAVEGMVITAGALLDWLVRDLRLFDGIDDLSRAASSVDSSAGVAICPSLQGLGAPYNDLNRRAAIVGLTGASTPAQIARAAFESLAFRMREIVEAAEAIEDIQLPNILPVDGGLAVNDVFLQIQADMLGRPVARHRNLEATALGACIGAALGIGLATREELVSLTHTEESFEPQIGADEANSRLIAWRAAIDL